MPLHLLGKKSWNVYNADNIARVKSDEAAAAAREASEEQRIQEIDAAQRAAILRGQTPPPLPDKERPHTDETRKSARRDGHEKKRRKLAGEDDTDRDIRLASSIRGGGSDGAEDSGAHLVKLRKPTSDAPLVDHAGNINLFPVDVKEQMKRAKNEEAEREKRNKERALEDQYRMRFSNAAGRRGLEQEPWYASRSSNGSPAGVSEEKAIPFPTLENKNVWGNEDPLRKEREHARRASNDPFALMQQAQVQLKKSKDDRKKWAAERDRELMELRAAQERSSRREKHGKRKKRVDDDHDDRTDRDAHDKGRSLSHSHRHRSRSRSCERRREHSATHRRREPKRSRSGDEGRGHRDHTNDTDHHRRGVVKNF